MMIERELSRNSAPYARGMSLEGAEALELYLAEIARNLDAIDQHLTLLQTTFAERQELLREIDACLRREGRTAV